jgi:cobalt/nickel transport system permease protein
MYRYLGLFVDEVRRMKRARECRGGGGRWLWQTGRMGHLAGAMFLRSYERGERVYLNLLSRGYRGRFYHRQHQPLRWRDYAFIAAVVAAFAAIRTMAA